MGINSIRLVKDTSGAWTGLYINGKLAYQGHGIPSHVWLQALAGAVQVTTEEELDFLGVGIVRLPEFYYTISKELQI